MEYSGCGVFCESKTKPNESPSERTPHANRRAKEPSEAEAEPDADDRNHAGEQRTTTPEPEASDGATTNGAATGHGTERTKERPTDPHTKQTHAKGEEARTPTHEKAQPNPTQGGDRKQEEKGNPTFHRK